jgi:hypothetical protein
VWGVMIGALRLALIGAVEGAITYVVLITVTVLFEGVRAGLGLAEIGRDLSWLLVIALIGAAVGLYVGAIAGAITLFLVTLLTAITHPLHLSPAIIDAAMERLWHPTFYGILTGAFITVTSVGIIPLFWPGSREWFSDSGGMFGFCVAGTIFGFMLGAFYGTMLGAFREVKRQRRVANQLAKTLM